MEIDVSECCYYNADNSPFCCELYDNECEAQNCYFQQLQQLKAEVKSKTEYIQEQRDIINQYSKEIEMYKKCQGKRASKREEELKAENEKLQEMNNNLSEKFANICGGCFEQELREKYEQCLDELDEVLKDFIFTDIKLFKIKNIIKQTKENRNV